MPSIEHDSTTIHYEVRGSGPAALLFNHIGASCLGWREEFLELLSACMQVVTLDFRGTGRSGPSSPNLLLSDLARDGLAVLEAEKIQTAAIVGASMGGAVAQEFALAFPKEASLLILLGTFAGDRHMIPPDAGVLRLFEFPQTLSKVERLRRILPAYYSEDFLRLHEDLALEVELKGARYTTDETLLHQNAATRKFDSHDNLPSITTPTLILHGTADPIIPFENGRTLAERIPDAEFQPFERVGHLPAVEKPAEVAARIVRFAVDHGFIRNPNS